MPALLTRISTWSRPIHELDNGRAVDDVAGGDARRTSRVGDLRPNSFELVRSATDQGDLRSRLSHRYCDRAA